MARRARGLIVRWSLRAEADLDRIWHFLATRSVDIADRIEASIRSRVEPLADFPQMGRVQPRLGIRELVLHDIQYRVGYDLRDETVMIVAVRSTREKA